MTYKLGSVTIVILFTLTVLLALIDIAGNIWWLRLIYLPTYTSLVVFSVCDAKRNNEKISRMKTKARKEKIRNQWIAEYQEFYKEMHGRSIKS